MTHDLLVDPDALREQVRIKYREVAAEPNNVFHFHTGRPLADRLGYEPSAVAKLPDRAGESFAGVGNPFSLRRLDTGDKFVDVGSGAGFDSFIAAGQVGPTGYVRGVDMTSEMLHKSRHTAAALSYEHVEFREGLAEALPVEDAWADAVISNGVINLCADKQAVFAEIYRIQARRMAPVRRHRQRPSGAGRCAARHRSVDRLNSRRAAPCGLATDARRMRFH